MRVLYIIDSLQPGGAERSLATLTPLLIDRGVRLDVACLQDRDGVQRELLAAGATLHLLDASGRVGWARQATALTRSLRPDLVHTTLFEADLAGRAASLMTRTPVVSSLVNIAYGPEQAAAPGIRATRLKLAQLADAVTARRAVRLHAVSSHVADTMSRRLRFPRHRIDVVPRGRNPQALGERAPQRRAAARCSVGLAPSTPLILGVGRLEHQKGFDTLLDAFAHVRDALPDARLLIAGRDGAQAELLREGAARFGGAVELLGPRDDVAELLCAADVLAFPSRWEGMPGTLIEAMALKAPIVASDIAPNREVIGATRCARLVSPEDPMSLATALLDTLRDPAGSEARALLARERFLAALTTDRAADGMVALYRRALER